MDSIAQLWFGAFMDTVKTHEASAALREAAACGELKHWTQALTESSLARSQRWDGEELHADTDLTCWP